MNTPSKNPSPFRASVRLMILAVLASGAWFAFRDLLESRSDTTVAAKPAAEEPAAIIAGAETPPESTMPDAAPTPRKPIIVPDNAALLKLSAAELPMDFSTDESRAESLALMKAWEDAKRAEAKAWAEARHAPMAGRTPADGSYALQRLDELGQPVYYRSANSRAALSANVGLNLRISELPEGNGTGWTAGLWDAGPVKADHRILEGRMQVINPGSVSGHATHAAGTIAGSATTGTYEQEGMAPGATVASYDWNNVYTEMNLAGARTAEEARAGNKLTVSCHPYSTFAGWEFLVEAPAGAPSPNVLLDNYYWTGPPSAGTDSKFGQYDTSSWLVDYACFQAPYYLPVFAAGNDRNDQPSWLSRVHYQTAPGVWASNTMGIDTFSAPDADGEGTTGYDSISPQGIAKNVLTVGNHEDLRDWSLSEDNFRDSPANMEMADESSAGPCDDGRIKPDLVANGTSLNSSDTEGDGGFKTRSGTSGSAAVVTGVALLLQQRHTNLLGTPMPASMLKGLLLHTTDGSGSLQPNALSGFGILNADRAFNQLYQHFLHPERRTMYHGLLVGNEISPGAGVPANISNADTEEFFIRSTNVLSLNATLCWTDPPGYARTGHNDRTSSLVHDLDLRIYSVEGGWYGPWRLNPANPGQAATVGDNTVDTVEKTGPQPWNSSSGLRRVMVSHKGLSRTAPSGSLPKHPKADMLLSTPYLQSAVPAQAFSLLMSGAEYAGSFVEATESHGIAWRQYGNKSYFGWFPQTAVNSDLEDAAQSPPNQSANSTSGFTGSVRGPGVLSFSAKTNAISGNTFRFWLNGAQTYTTNANTWQPYSVTLPAGLHLLEFEYATGATPGTAWVDQISVLPVPANFALRSDGPFALDMSWSYPRPGSAYRILSNTTPSETGATTVRVVGMSNPRSNTHRELITQAGLYYAVSVLDQYGKKFSPVSAWLQSNTKPLTLTGLQASDGTYAGKVEVTWNGSISANSYVLSRTPSGGATTQIVIAAGQGTAYTDTAVSPGQVITYTVAGRSLTNVTGDSSLPDTGYARDPAAANVVATDGTIPNAVKVTWNATADASFRCLRTSTNVSPASGGVSVEPDPSFQTYQRAVIYDTTAVPGVVYYYWVQIRPRVPDTAPWGDFVGSDSGSAGASPDYAYAISDSDNVSGPRYAWVDVAATGEQLQGKQVLSPTVTIETGSEFFPVGRLTDGSGLSGATTLSNLNTITHAAASGTNAWVTNAFGSDYFTNGGPPPQLNFLLPFTGYDFVNWNISELVIWGYHFGGGTTNANEAKNFTLAYLDPVNAQTGSQAVVSPSMMLANPNRIATSGSGAKRVRMTITDNWFGTGAGGDRVGLGEVKFVGERNLGFGQPVTIFGDSNSTVASRHGYLALKSTGGPGSTHDDNGLDAGGDTAPLPKAPGNGGTGARVAPWHSDLVFAPGGGIFYELTRNRHPHGATGERVDVWQWQNVQRTAGGPVFSFQVLYFTGIGDFLFQYPPGHPSSGDATIGIQHWPNRKAATFSAQVASTVPTDRSFAVLFKKQATATTTQRTVHQVTTTADENDAALGAGAGNSLRELIKLAPADADGIRRIALPASMAGATLTIGNTLLIDTVTPVEIDAGAAPGLVLSGGTQRLFTMQNTSTAPYARILTLKNLTLANATLTNDSGGAIATPFNYSGPSYLTLENVTITNCRANGTGKGGAIWLRGDTILTMINCTISGNSAGAGGGAIFAETASEFHLTNCTLTNNSATAGSGGGILNEISVALNPGRNRLTSTIIAANTSTSGGADLHGVSGSQGGNLIGNAASATGLLASDITGQPAQLSALADNGGPTKTHALLPGSPAVDASLAFLAKDQRGVTRGSEGDFDVAGAGPDIGAYELLVPLVVTTAADTVNASDGVLSLREAVQIANAANSGDIRFDAAAMGGQTITVATELPLTARKSITINGDARSTTVTVLGTGTAALLGGDLTDPENNINDTTGTGANWEATFASEKNYFTPFGASAEGALDVFDNKVGGGEAKWCCGGAPQQLTVKFATPVSLTHFTIASADDTISTARIPLDFQILGSNDGSYYEPIFTRVSNTPLWTAENQVLRFDLPVATPLYRYIRYSVTRTNGGTLHQLGEIEYFGSGTATTTPTASQRITVAGGAGRRIFNNTGEARLSNLTLTAGNIAGDGGGILNTGALTLTHCEITNCQAVNWGGGIYSSGTLGLVNCTVANCTANYGGGVLSFGAAARTSLVHSTLAGNTAEHGGGLDSGGGSRTRLLGCTVSANTATASEGGGGIFNHAGAGCEIENCIIAGNFAPASSFPNIAGSTLTTSGANILSGDPVLAPLGTYGGPVRTMPPMAGSPALEIAGLVSTALVAPETVVTTTAVSPPNAAVTAVRDRDPATAFEGYRSDLVAQWNFNDTTNDLIAARPGTLQNGAVLSADSGSRYVQTFDAFANGATSFGDGSSIATSHPAIAVVQSGALRLTQDTTGSTLTNFRLPPMTGSATGWSATFDFTITVTGEAADGFSFSWGAIPAGLAGNEGGWGGGVNHVAFSIDTYGTDTGVRISNNEITRAQTLGTVLNTPSTVSGRAEITWDPVSGANFRTTGLVTNANFVNIPTPGFTAADANIFAFVARTGGSTETVLIDNLYITAGNSGRTGLAGDKSMMVRGAAFQGMKVLNSGAFLNGPAAVEKLTVTWWQRQRQRTQSTSFWGTSPTTNDTRGIALHAPWVDDNIYFDTAGCCDGGGERIFTASPLWARWNQWTHVAVVRSGIQKEVWINGRLALAGANTEPLPTNFTDLLIGFSNVPGQTAIDGWLDDFAVFSSALTPADIAALASGALPPAEAALVFDAPGVATTLQLTAAADRAELDPAGYRVEGSVDGEDYTFLAAGTVPAFSDRSATQDFALPPAAFYRQYRVTLTGAAGSAARQSVRVAEVQLLFAPATDQRGLPRLAGSGSDAGAAETGRLFVTTQVDENNGLATGGVSLRDALTAAAQAEIIGFDPLLFNGEAGDAIVLTNGVLTIPGVVSIDATGLTAKVHVSGNNASRVLTLAGTGTAVLRNLVLRNGSNPAGEGGGIFNQGRLVMANCEVRSNTALRDGGGLRSTGATSSLFLKDCLIADNIATGYAGAGVSLDSPGLSRFESCTFANNQQQTTHTYSGGGLFAWGSLVQLTNCTFSGNSAVPHGGAIYLANNASATLTHCTVSGNNGTTGGIYRNPASLVLSNSIVAGNAGANLAATAGGTLTETGFNLTIGDPKLAPLANYGGLTPTMALRSGTPALNTGAALTTLPAGDQRSYARISGGIADLGAFESSALDFVSFTDSDGDGMDDAWEDFFGLNPASAADGTTDLDADGQSNAAEFSARTAPDNAGSLLTLLSSSRTPGPANTTNITLDWTSVPGVTYSVWSSSNLTIWEPIAGSNIIAIEAATLLTVNTANSAREFLQVRTGPGDTQPAVYAAQRHPVEASSAWLHTDIISGGANTAVTRWEDFRGADDIFPNGSPTYRLHATPTDATAVEFRGGTFNDALATNVASNLYSLNAATAFTAVVTFKPDANSEVAAGTQWTDKSQLLSAETAGPGNDWGVSYADDKIWFGIGDTQADVTLQAPAGTTMAGKWWTAVVTWRASDGTGAPQFAAWLFDAEGNALTPMALTNPNTTAGTTGRFTAPRANSGLALGGARTNLTSRNFAGHIAATLLYNVPVDLNTAQALAESMANSYTSAAQPQ